MVNIHDGNSHLYVLYRTVNFSNSFSNNKVLDTIGIFDNLWELYDYKTILIGNENNHISALVILSDDEDEDEDENYKKQSKKFEYVIKIHNLNKVQFNNVIEYIPNKNKFGFIIEKSNTFTYQTNMKDLFVFVKKTLDCWLNDVYEMLEHKLSSDIISVIKTF